MQIMGCWDKDFKRSTISVINDSVKKMELHTRLDGELQHSNQNDMKEQNGAIWNGSICNNSDIGMKLHRWRSPY